ncbi:hypothetical protein QL285_059875 [Trifolium repens]|nr:hypothetical protein QL285_059875 [Trifolium repens]
MGTEVSGEASNAIHENCQIADCARKLIFFPEPGVQRKSVSVCSAQMASLQELLEEFRDLHLEVEFAPGNLRLVKEVCSRPVTCDHAR